MSSYQTFAAALAPWTENIYSSPDLSSSINQMIAANANLGLGLTDQQIVDGINAFASGSSKQFGLARPLTLNSNYSAIANESIMQALNLAGKDGGKFWQDYGQSASYPRPAGSTLLDTAGMTNEQAFRGSIAPYIGWTYYATGPGYYNPTPTWEYISALNDKLGLELTPEEIAYGVREFGDASMALNGLPLDRFPNATSANNMNYQGKFTDLSDPFAIARESIGHALRKRGISEDVINKDFFTPLQEVSSKFSDASVTAANNLSAEQNRRWEIVNPDDDRSLFKRFVSAAAPVIGIAAAGAGMPWLSSLVSGANTGNPLSLLSGAAGAAGFDFGGLLGESGADFFGEGTAGAIADFGAGAASSLGGVAASEGTGMFDDIFNWLSGGTDFFGEGTPGAVADWLGGSGSEFASQDIVDLFNNAGTEGFNQYGVSLDDLAAQLFDQAGTAGFDQYGNEAFGLDWLKSQLPSGTSSDTAAKLGKLLFGEGGAAGGGLLGGGTGTGQGSLLGALLGGLAGSYNGAKQDGTINTTQTPWGPQQPYLLDAWEKAKQASNNPINTQAQSNYQQVLQGPTTNPYMGQDNPYLQKQIDNTNADVTRAMMPAMNQANKASGSFGNSGVADIYSKNMTDAYSRNANDMRFKDYYAQMQLQKDAVNNTLGFTQGSSAFNAAPAQDYAKTVQGNYGGTKSEPYFTNPASSILGGATLGYNLFGR
jgi:hypothetical protein